MSEIYVSSPESAVEAPVVEPPAIDVPAVEAPVVEPVSTPPIPVSPPPSSESDDESGSESDTEESETESESGVRRRLVIGPDDDRLYIRRQVAAGESPAVYAVAGLPIDSDVDLGAAPDDYVVPNQGTLIVDTLTADGILGSRVSVPVWVILTVVIVMAAYMCLLIGSGMLVLQGPTR